MVSISNIKQNKQTNLIVNADDFNISSHRNKAILKLVDKHIIKSISALITTEIFPNKEEIDILLSKNVSIGLHLNLTEGKPISSHEFISLTDEKGYFHGKFNFFQKVEEDFIKKEEIKLEIISQIKSFQKKFGFLPSHIDGHQHIQSIPFLAIILSEIMNSFCIYKTRIPIEYDYYYQTNNVNSVSYNKNNFYDKVIKMSLTSKDIYTNNGISFPKYFLGISFMGIKFNEELIVLLIDKIIKEDNNDNIFIELMCHPGFKPDDLKNQWDEFDGLEDRELEYEKLFKLNTLLLKKDIRTISYNQLPIIYNKIKKNIVVGGDLLFATGNNLTAQRLKLILSKKYSCILFNFSDANLIINRLKEGNDDMLNSNSLIIKYLFNLFNDFLVVNQIDHILGINLYRIGMFLNRFFLIDDYIKLSYSLIIAGTDANYYIDKEDSQTEITNIINNASGVIGLNKILTQKVLSKYKNILCKFITIHQSVEVNKQVDNLLLKRKDILNNLNISFNIEVEDLYITVLPSGIRNIKDPLYLISSFKNIIDKHSNCIFFIIGSIFDYDLYIELKKQIENYSESIFILDHLHQKDFYNILRISNVILNSSISEGMSNVIMESMLFKKILIVRNNEGNTYLIENEKTGFVFNNQIEFEFIFEKVLNNKYNIEDIKFNAYEKIRNEFSFELESKMYLDYFSDLFMRYNHILTINKEVLNINILSPEVHPFSYENNELFYNIEYDFPNKEINIIDIGCGWGTMSIVFLSKYYSFIKNNNIVIKNLIFTDINQWCLYNVKSNILNLPKYIFENVKNIKYIISDLLENKDISLLKYDLLFVNLPQSPCYENMRADKYGGQYGSELYERLMLQLKDMNIFNPYSEIYYLHISLCNPFNFSKFIKNIGYDEEIIFIQKRKINISELEVLKKGILDYWNKIKSQGYMDYDYINEKDIEYIEYKVYLKKILINQIELGN